MPALSIIRATAREWNLQHALPAVLRETGFERLPEPRAKSQNDGLSFVFTEKTKRPKLWPGADFGIRPPGIDETPLSESEALMALRDGK